MIGVAKKSSPDADGRDDETPPRQYELLLGMDFLFDSPYGRGACQPSVAGHDTPPEAKP
jgi:hypothetical protein